MSAVRRSTWTSKRFPHLAAVLQLLMAGKRGKGHGEDSIPAEFLLAAPREIARLLWPLFLKATLRMEEPLAWKGGMLAEIAKSGGQAMHCSASRGVLVSDASGKLLHGWVKRALRPSTERAERMTQFGSTGHAGTDFCSHLARSYWSFLSWACLSGF